MTLRALALCALIAGLAPAVAAQQAPPAGQTPPPPAQTPAPTAPAPSAPAPGAPAPAAPDTKGAPPAPAGVTPEPDYVIGSGDVLAIVFWREQEMSAEVVVRPDGRISIPLLNDVDVVGLTPEQLRDKLMTLAQRYVQDPNVTVVVRQINSRRVFISGQVAKPGPYPLTASMNVLQLISTAGGILEYADGKNITIVRGEKGAKPLKFNYNDVIRGRNLDQNIELKPGDTVLVP